MVAAAWLALDDADAAGSADADAAGVAAAGRATALAAVGAWVGRADGRPDAAGRAARAARLAAWRLAVIVFAAALSLPTPACARVPRLSGTAIALVSLPGSAWLVPVNP